MTCIDCKANVHRIEIAGNRGKRRPLLSAHLYLPYSIIRDQVIPTLVSNELGHICGGRARQN